MTHPKCILTTTFTNDKDDKGSKYLDERIRYKLCGIDDLDNGQMKEFEIKTPFVNTTILLIKQNNNFYAYSSKCCHYKLPLVKGLI